MCYSYQSHVLALTHTHTAESRNHSGVQKMPIRINTGNCIEYKAAWRRARGQCNIVDQRKLFLDAHSECTRKASQSALPIAGALGHHPESQKRAIKVTESAFQYSDVSEGIHRAPALCSFVKAAVWCSDQKPCLTPKHVWGQILSYTASEHIQASRVDV